MMVEEKLKKPAWLEGLIAHKFFAICGSHQNLRKSEKNIFCLNCCQKLCPHCAPSHQFHPLLQVRRYVYHDVIRLDDIDKLINCSQIQPYTINSAKVVFLNPRPQTRISKVSPNVCLTCERILQDPFHFCSLSCKVDFAVQCGDLAGILRKFDEANIAFSQVEVHEDEKQIKFHEEHNQDEDIIDVNDAYSSSAPLTNSGTSHDLDSEVVMKKDCCSSTSGFANSSNRRKGTPHRAPFS